MIKVNNKNSYLTKREIIQKDFKRNKALYAMFIPIALYFILFKYVPMFGIAIAFQDFTPYQGVFNSEWVGFYNFERFFNSPYFSTLLINTLKISFSTLLFTFPAPIILALLLNEMKNRRYAKVVQSILYMPHFISIIVVIGMLKSFTMDTGIINTLFEFFGFERVSMLNHKEYFIPLYVSSALWQELGWGTIVYLSALTGIDMELYEAAKIDGANRWRQTLSITLPSIIPTIVTLLILRVGSILNVGFEKIILMYNDNTSPVAEVISSYVYKKGLLEQDWSYSSAVGIFNAVINLVLLTVTNYISKKTTETGLW